MDNINAISNQVYKKDFYKLSNKQKEFVKILDDDNYFFLKIIVKVNYYNDKKNKIKGCFYSSPEEEQKTINYCDILAENIVNELINTHNYVSVKRIKDKFTEEIKNSLSYGIYNVDVLTLDSKLSILKTNQQSFINFYIAHIFYLI